MAEGGIDQLFARYATPPPSVPQEDGIKEESPVHGVKLEHGFKQEPDPLLLPPATSTSTHDLVDSRTHDWVDSLVLDKSCDSEFPCSRCKDAGYVGACKRLQLGDQGVLPLQDVLRPTVNIEKSNGVLMLDFMQAIERLVCISNASAEWLATANKFVKQWPNKFDPSMTSEQLYPDDLAAIQHIYYDVPALLFHHASRDPDSSCDHWFEVGLCFGAQSNQAVVQFFGPGQERLSILTTYLGHLMVLRRKAAHRANCQLHAKDIALFIGFSFAIQGRRLSVCDIEGELRERLLEEKASFELTKSIESKNEFSLTERQSLAQLGSCMHGPGRKCIETQEDVVLMQEAEAELEKYLAE